MLAVAEPNPPLRSARAAAAVPPTPNSTLLALAKETPRVLFKALEPVRAAPPSTPTPAPRAAAAASRATPTPTTPTPAAGPSARHTLVVAITNGCGAAAAPSAASDSETPEGATSACWGFFVRYSLLGVGVDAAGGATTSASLSPSRAPRGEHALWWDTEAALNTRARHSVALRDGQSVAALVAAAAEQSRSASSDALVVDIVSTAGKTQAVVGTATLSYARVCAFFRDANSSGESVLEVALPIEWEGEALGTPEGAPARAANLDVRLAYSVAPIAEGAPPARSGSAVPAAHLAGSPVASPAQTTLMSTATTKERLLPRNSSLLINVQVCFYLPLHFK